MKKNDRIKGIGKTALRLAVILICAFLINTVILLVSKKNPIEIYSILLKGAFGNLYNVARSLRWATPLIFTALAFSVSARCGVFNIGADGQLYMGAFAAAWVGFTFTGLPRVVLIPLAMLAAMLAGMLWSMLAGWISIKFKANIIVITLMLNYIAILFTEYLVRYPFYVPGTLGEAGSTEYVAEAARLTVLIPRTNVTTGLIIGIVAAVLLWLFNRHTVLGYETEIIGANERFSSFMGLDVRKKQMIVFVMTGMIAGLGGAVEILGNYGRFMVNFASGLGFDGIVVSLLANGNPIGIIFAALFMGAMTSGSIAVEMFGGVPKAMTGILLGVIIMIITVKFVPDFQKRKKSKKKENKPC